MTRNSGSHTSDVHTSNTLPSVAFNGGSFVGFLVLRVTPAHVSCNRNYA